MRPLVWLRPALGLLSVCVFGALDAMIKGRHGGLRDAVGKEQRRLIDAIDAAESDER